MNVVLSVCLPVIGPGLSSTSPDNSSSNLKWGGGYTLLQVFIVNPDLNQLSVIVSLHCTLDHEQWVTIPIIIIGLSLCAMPYYVLVNIAILHVYVSLLSSLWIDQNVGHAITADTYIKHAALN